MTDENEQGAEKLPCERCGDFIAVLPGGSAAHRVCENCAEIEGVMPANEYGQELWGKADGFVWANGLLGFFFGAWGVTLTVLLVALTQNQYVGGLSIDSGLLVLAFALLTTSFLVITLCYVLRYKWARWALSLPYAMLALASLLLVTIQPSDLPIVAFLAANVFCLSLLVWGFFSSRNKLAFKIEISDERLDALYRTRFHNRPARYSLILGVLGLLLPPLSVLALITGIVGFRRAKVDSPVKRKKEAIAGLALSIVGLIEYLLLIVYLA